MHGLRDSRQIRDGGPRPPSLRWGAIAIQELKDVGTRIDQLQHAEKLLERDTIARDGYRCRGCGASGRGKRKITVHHRVPGVSRLELMISLCPGCHAKVERTKMVLAEMTPLLLELWREQHPAGQEQVMLAFNARGPATQAVPLAFDDPQSETARRGE